MRLICFGDSFTQGEGTNHSVTNTLSYGEQQKYERSHAWPKYLSDLCQVDYVNYGETGSSNYRIFNNIFEMYSKFKIRSNDVIIIAWSSPLRDHLPFFPNLFSRNGPIGLSWSLKELAAIVDHSHPFTRYFTDDDPVIKQYVLDDMTPFMKRYFNFYLQNLHDESYYKKLNTNYICLLQKYFAEKEIKLFMFDAFENLNFDNVLVDTSKYFQEKTLYDWIDEQHDDTFFEDKNFINININNHLHPSELGHQLIAKNIYNIIHEKL